MAETESDFSAPTATVPPGAGAADDHASVAGSGRGLRVALSVVIVLALLVVAAAGGWFLHGADSHSTVSDSSVDAGFARDMSTHHQQAIVMAGYTRDHTANPAIKLLATDIETGQQFQLGQMQGWLDAWGLDRESSHAPMSWMAGHDHLESDGLMPGMATPAQMTKLETLSGTELDVFFLQLMIHHHQGGLPMEQYAASHASKQYVRQLASSMQSAQSGEIISMEQLLRQLGASPLPAPAN